MAATTTPVDWRAQAEELGVFLLRMSLQLLAVPLQLVLWVAARFLGRPTPGNPAPKSLVITGASSGIGEALAVSYAGPGVALLLTGRRADALDRVAAACEAKGARVVRCAVDVTDAPAMERALLGFDAEYPVELGIANAGISSNTAGVHELGPGTRALFATNIDGVMNTILPLIPRMQERRRGQLVLVSSLAGIGSLTASHIYSASKACVKVYGEGLRGVLANDGVQVNVVCPGYVASPMTDLNKFPMPWKWTMPRAVACIRAGLAANRAVIDFPWQLSTLRLLDSHWLLPELRDWMGRMRLVPFLAYLKPAQAGKADEDLVVAQPVVAGGKNGVKAADDLKQD